jgi:Fe-S cluster assembly ATPase SufC
MCAIRSFQSPVEVPGVSNSDFLRLAANARRKQLGQEELGPLEFYGYVMPKVTAHSLHAQELFPKSSMSMLDVTSLCSIVFWQGLS